jgi:DtxR family Mn-dependent transcriptional regulator
MQNPFTHATQDYLKTIYDLTRSGERASTNQIADRLKIKPASVTGMVKKMAQTTPPLVDYQKHHGVSLTPEGERSALKVIRLHRLLECFLHVTLGYDWDAVHAEACRMEHVVSDEFEQRIADVLGNPSHDPHGDPIPDENLNMPVDVTISLSDLCVGQQATIQRVRDQNAELLRDLSQRGVIPGASLTVLDYSRFDGNLHLQINGQEETVVLGPRVARQIFVTIES